MINADKIVVSLQNVIFVFVAVLIVTGIIYICYKLNKCYNDIINKIDEIQKQYDKGLDVNLIAHRQYNDEECGWDR